MENRFAPVSVSSFSPVREFISRTRQPFNDKRRYSTWRKLLMRLEQSGSCVVQQLSNNRAECEQFYRFLRNKQVQLAELIQMSCHVNAELLAGRHVLVLGDSTSYNLKSHMGRIQDREQVGVLEDNKTPGFMCHVHLAVDAQSNNVLGLSDVLLWSRPKSQGKSLPSYMLKGEDKESYKWFLGIENATAVLKQAAKRTFVLDRDADNYDLFSFLSGKQDDHFVIRSRHDRQVYYQNQEHSMSSSLAQSSSLGTYTLDLPALDHYSSTSGKRVKRQARKATLEVRAIPIQVLPPLTHGHPGGSPLALSIVEAREINLVPDSQDEPICWRLITSHPVLAFEQAQDIIRFYCTRWIIEQLFRTSKSEGFDIESTELETFQAIQGQTVLVLHAAARVLQLVYARQNEQAQPIEEVFDQQECVVLNILNTQLEGATDKQKNPYPKTQTSWATWVIARLGGWKGYSSQRPPGPITIKMGLDKFYIFLKAFQMMKASG
jgi:hypothetical protein